MSNGTAYVAELSDAEHKYPPPLDLTAPPGDEAIAKAEQWAQERCQQIGKRLMLTVKERDTGRGIYHK